MERGDKISIFSPPLPPNLSADPVADDRRSWIGWSTGLFVKLEVIFCEGGRRANTILRSFIFSY